MNSSVRSRNSHRGGTLTEHEAIVGEAEEAIHYNTGDTALQLLVSVDSLTETMAKDVPALYTRGATGYGKNRIVWSTNSKRESTILFANHFRKTKKLPMLKRICILLIINKRCKHSRLI